MNNVIMAFILTVLAGLATGIGGLTIFMVKKPSEKFMAFSLGFSAGVMIYVSLTEIFPQANASLANVYEAKTALGLTALSFFAGMAVIGIIDKLIPEEINPHEMNDGSNPKSSSSLMKMGIFTALALAIHNFPEGIATFFTALEDPTIAIPIIIAIAIHNIPEGIAVAVPLYQATGNRKKAFWYALLSGLTEPLGAIVGYMILMPFLNDAMFGMIFSAVAGIMVYISLDELLPTAEKYGYHHYSIWGVVLGMILMAISIVMFM